MGTILAIQSRILRLLYNGAYYRGFGSEASRT